MPESYASSAILYEAQSRGHIGESNNGPKRIKSIKSYSNSMSAVDREETVEPSANSTQ